MIKFSFKFIIFIFFLITSFPTYAENVYFIDFTRVLNSSNAGAEAQNKLKKKFEDESKKFIEKENKIKKDEQDLIAKKKAISSEEYKKNVEKLRNEVNLLQKEKQISLNSIAKSRSDAKQELIKAVNPIIKKYMEENKIRLVLDKQSVVLGDTNLEITDQIINILNQELKSIKVK